MKLEPRIKAKRWQPKIEEDILKLWESEKLYRFRLASRKPIFSIDTPPPYASGRWGVAQATHYAQIDMVARYFRMKGYEVIFPFGVDRNGLPIEMEVEKIHGVSAQQTPRDQFLTLCRSFLDRVEKDLVWVARRMGMSCSLEDYYRTDSPEYRAVTQASFIDLWNKGLIYEDAKPTNWCSVCRTTIADAEIEYREESTKLYTIRFKADGGEVSVSTTRPELLCSCAAILFNPEDARYSNLEGMSAVVPIYSQKVPILAHGYAKPEFGTGLVMICSFGDYSDIRLFRELELRPKTAINMDGRMTEAAGPYRGLKVEEARSRVVEDLSAQGVLVGKEEVKHKVPVCWRTGNPIEFISMPEFYLRQLDHVENLHKLAEKMIFHPPESKQLLMNWINSISIDYPISRRRFYGTEIPLWYCKSCGKPYLPGKGKYYQPWREQPPHGRCECGSTQFRGEERTLDTWMDSSLTQLIVIGYPDQKRLFRKAFPCSLRPQGQDIVRTWLYYSLLKTYHLLSSAPFVHVRVSGMGLDEKGEAMHKSKGNVVLPEPVFDRFGVDAFRLWGSSEAKLGSNYRFSEDRVGGASKFLTKLWNISRFISSFPVVNRNFRLAKVDRMILGELNRLINLCRMEGDNMDFFGPSLAVRSFAWSVFADHYIEAVKARAYNADGSFDKKLQRGAWYTLHTCLKTILKLLAPVCPFITEAVWREVYSKRSIHLEGYPEKQKAWRTNLTKLLDRFTSVNSAIWGFKKSRGIPLNKGLSAAYIPRELKPLAETIASMHRIKNLRLGAPGGSIRSKAFNVDDFYFVP